MSDDGATDDRSIDATDDRSIDATDDRSIDADAVLDDPVPSAIRDLERVLGVALILQDLEPGPPVRITAVGLYDGQTTPFVVEAATEHDAWIELGRALAVWRNVDPRNVRYWVGA